MVLAAGFRNRRKFSLYFLRCPVSGLVRYIGVTCNENLREAYHLQKDKRIEKESPRKRRWLLWLKKMHLKPIFEVKLSGLSWHSAIAAEKRLLLLHHTFTPWRLLNKSVYELAPVEDGGLAIFLRKLGNKVGQHLDFYA